MHRKPLTIACVALGLACWPLAARAALESEFAKGFHAGLAFLYVGLAETDRKFLQATLSLRDRDGRELAGFSFQRSIHAVETAFAGADGETATQAARYVAILRKQAAGALAQGERDELPGLLYRLLYRVADRDVKLGFYMARGFLNANLLLNADLDIPAQARKAAEHDLLYRATTPVLENSGLYFTRDEADAFAAAVFSSDLRALAAAFGRVIAARLGLGPAGK